MSTNRNVTDAEDPISILTFRERLELVRNELEEHLLTSSGDTLGLTRSHVEIYRNVLDAALLQPEANALNGDSTTLTSLIGMFREREQVGMAKYGTTVDRTDLTNAQWRQHLREELMDALLYSLREEQTMGEQADGAVAFIAISQFSGPVLQPLEGFDRLPTGNHNLYTRPAASQPADVECRKCGSKSADEASTRCIPDSFGDSCPGCEEPIASAWDSAARPSPAGGVPDGWQLMPIKLTPEMRAAFMQGMSWTNLANSACTASDVEHLFDAMRAAAPEVPRG